MIYDIIQSSNTLNAAFLKLTYFLSITLVNLCYLSIILI